MPRTRPLALTLAALALAATFAAGSIPPGLRWPMRLTLIFALPALSGVLASLLMPRSAKRLGSSARVLGTARFHAVVAAVVVIDLAAIGIGYALGWTTFTFGEQTLEAWKRLAVPLALPFTIATATLGTEWALHSRLWEVLSRRTTPGYASFFVVGLGALLTLPVIAPGFEVVDRPYFASALVIVLAREAIALALFRSGGLFVAGAYRGTLVAIEGFGLADWYSYYFPMANFVSSVPLFYLLRATGPLLAMALVLYLARRSPTPA
jgi:hypothetical protein